MTPAPVQKFLKKHHITANHLAASHGLTYSSIQYQVTKVDFTGVSGRTLLLLSDSTGLSVGEVADELLTISALS